MNLLTGSPLADWVSGSPYPTKFCLFDATYLAITWGMFQGNTLLDPSFVVGGPGQWGYAQTVNATLTVNGNVFAGTGLDGHSFPAKNSIGGSTAWSPSDGTSKRLYSDKPGYDPVDLSQNIVATFRGDFKLYIFYQPPPSLAGSSVFVPIQCNPWKAYGGYTFTFPTTFSAPPYDSGSAFGVTVVYPALSAWPTWPA